MVGVLIWKLRGGWGGGKCCCVIEALWGNGSCPASRVPERDFFFGRDHTFSYLKKIFKNKQKKKKKNPSCNISKLNLCTSLRLVCWWLFKSDGARNWEFGMIVWTRDLTFTIYEGDVNKEFIFTLIFHWAGVLLLFLLSFKRKKTFKQPRNKCWFILHQSVFSWLQVFYSSSASEFPQMIEI